MESDLIKQIESIKASEASLKAIESAKSFLKSLKCGKKRLESCHNALCEAMLTSMKTDCKAASDLLQLCGPRHTLMVAYSNIAHSELPGGLWLSKQIQQLLISGGLTTILKNEAGPPPLTLEQEHLVGILCRLPDSLANRLGRQLPPSLLPSQYFGMLGCIMVECLKGEVLSNSDNVAFLATMLGKAAVLGQRESILGPLLSELESHVTQDAVWRRVSVTLFSLVPPAGLERVLEAVMLITSPSIQPSTTHALLGDLILNSQKAKFVLTHKLILVRMPSSPNAVYNLIGYLVSCDPNLLGKSLELTLGVWSDSSALRHMSGAQHQWISSVLMLGINCLKDTTTFKECRERLQRLTMAGVEAHIQSPLEGLRVVGMAVGGALMNTLCPVQPEDQLQFQYEATEHTEALLRLIRPLSEIQRELEELRVVSIAMRQEVSEARESSEVCEGGEGYESSKSGGGRFGEGMVKTLDCSDSDSDDDLQPYAMDDDPPSNVPRPPLYLRTLIQGLLSSKDPLKMESSLKVAERLIRSEPSDLSQVCVELAKILLHLSNVYALSEFARLRLDSLTALCSSCPQLVAPYLTGEFYAPHYNLRQRMDVLEVIASAALELSQPCPLSSEERGTSHQPVRKPWEEVIEERLKTKTRIISKGRTKAPPVATPNRFADVAPLFFYPLMSSYDCPRATLDLLGQDSLVLGNLLYTLGTVMHAARHAPISGAMGMALLDFTWALRYHSAVYVRQGVLYSLVMLLCATPMHTLMSEMEGGLGEAIQWVVGVASDDADTQCRALAQHVLSVFESTLKEIQGGR